MAIAQEVLADYTGNPRIAAFWAPRLARFAEWFAETEAARRAGMPGRYRKLTANWCWTGLRARSHLTARADRIDVGGGPDYYGLQDCAELQNLAGKRRAGGRRNCLSKRPLRPPGALPTCRPAPWRAALHLDLRRRAAGSRDPLKTDDVAELARKAQAGLARLIAAFDREGTPYRAMRRARFKYDYDDYAHLARVAEWPAETDEEDWIMASSVPPMASSRPARRRAATRRPPPIPALGLGQRQRRHGQDARADHARTAPAARRQQPERILALTYTKAAAAEMSTRVFERLAEWVTASDAALQSEAHRTARPGASPEEMLHARRLFARAIETPGGLKVQTIHAFCERLLQRFPLEAGVPPASRSSTISSAPSCWQRPSMQCWPRRRPPSDPPLARALAAAVGFAAEDNFDALLAEALRQHEWLDAAVRLDLDATSSWPKRRSIYRKAFGLEPAAPLRCDRGSARRCALRSRADARAGRAGVGLQRRHQGSRDDRGGARCRRRRRPHRGVVRLFLTSEGEPRKSLMTTSRGGACRCRGAAVPRATALRRPARRALQAAAPRGDPGAGAARRCGHAALRRRQGAARGARFRRPDRQGSEPAAVLGRRRMGALQARRRPRPHPGRRGAGYEPGAMAGDPRAGRGVLLRAGRQRRPRTLFAVGDEKQSIYSFQGAAPAMFAAAGDEFAAACRAGGHALAARTTDPVVPLGGAAARGGRPHLRQAGAHARADGVRASRSVMSPTGPVTPDWWRSGRWRSIRRPRQRSPGRRWRRPARLPPVVRLAARIAETIADGWTTGRCSPPRTGPSVPATS